MRLAKILVGLAAAALFGCTGRAPPMSYDAGDHSSALYEDCYHSGALWPRGATLRVCTKVSADGRCRERSCMTCQVDKSWKMRRC